MVLTWLNGGMNNMNRCDDCKHKGNCAFEPMGLPMTNCAWFTPRKIKQ